MSLPVIKYFYLKTVLVMTCSFLLLVSSQEECDSSLENMLSTLVSQDKPPTVQLQALRNELIRRIKAAIQREELENELLQYKRSLSSLAQWNNLPEKRNLESLARAGYIRTLPLENDPNFKRSSPILENGQHYRNNDRQMSYFDNMETYKRNVASLARSGMKINGKRNVAALLRQDNYLNGMRVGRDENQTENPRDNYEGKRNIASIKAQYKPKYKRSIYDNRIKRDVDYFDEVNEEYPLPVYQTRLNYNEDKYIGEEYQNPGKRFLGRLPQMGKLKTTPSPKMRYN